MPWFVQGIFYFSTESPMSRKETPTVLNKTTFCHSLSLDFSQLTAWVSRGNIQSAVFQEFLAEAPGFLSTSSDVTDYHLCRILLVKQVTKASLNLSDVQLNPMLRERQSCITEEKWGWWILSPPLEDMIYQAVCYRIFQRVAFSSFLHCLCLYCSPRAPYT